MSSFGVSTPGTSGQREIKTKIPVWIIIVLIILVILLIIVPIVVWFLVRRAAGKGTGDTCTVNTDCVTGLVCTNGTCSLPDCPKPGKVTGIDDTQVLDVPAWDVTLTWDAEANADFYIIYLGPVAGYDPETESDSIIAKI